MDSVTQICSVAAQFFFFFLTKKIQGCNDSVCFITALRGGENLYPFHQENYGHAFLQMALRTLANIWGHCTCSQRNALAVVRRYEAVCSVTVVRNILSVSNTAHH